MVNGHHCDDHGLIKDNWSIFNNWVWWEERVSLLHFWVSLHQWVVFSELRGGNDQKIFARLFYFSISSWIISCWSMRVIYVGSFLTAEFELIHCIIGLLSWHSYSSQKYMVLGQLKIPLRSAEYCNPFSCVFRSTVTIVNDLISWILYSKSFQCNVQLFSLLQRLSGPSSASHPSCKVEPLSPKF